MSVGKLSTSTMISVRPGRNATADIRALCKLMDVLSHAITESAAAPINGAIMFPTRAGMVSQFSFHERINRSRHSNSMVRCRTSRERNVNGPSELPSKYMMPSGISNLSRKGANGSAASSDCAYSVASVKFMNAPGKVGRAPSLPPMCPDAINRKAG